MAPPKKSSASKDSSSFSYEELKAVREKLSTDDNPSEADFLKIVSAASSDQIEVKKLSASTIGEHVFAFPKKAPEAIETLGRLAKDSELDVKKIAMRALLKQDLTSSEWHADVYKAIFGTLGDRDIDAEARDEILLKLKDQSEEGVEFRKLFIQTLPNVDVDARRTMVDFVFWNIKFDSKEELLPVIEQAMTCNKRFVLKFIGRYKDLIDSDRDSYSKAIISDIETGIKKNFKEYCEGDLLDILSASSNFEEEYGEQLFNILTDSVFPKLNEFESEARTRFMQILANNNKFATESTLEFIYDKIFMSIPKDERSYPKNYKFPFSLIEAFMYAFYKIGKDKTPKLSSLIGKHISFSGQPDETDNSVVDDSRRAEFEDRIKEIQRVVTIFISATKNEMDTYKAENSRDDPDYKKEMREFGIKLDIGRNIDSFCTLFLSDRIYSAHKKLHRPSWSSAKQGKSLRGAGKRRFSSSRGSGPGRRFVGDSSRSDRRDSRRDDRRDRRRDDRRDSRDMGRERRSNSRDSYRRSERRDSRSHSGRRYPSRR